MCVDAIKIRSWKCCSMWRGKDGIDDVRCPERLVSQSMISKAGYENIKGKLAYAYLEITSSLCEAVGTDTCNQAKEDFNNMKKSFGFTFDLIKELAKSGASKVKEFYENTFKN